MVKSDTKKDKPPPIAVAVGLVGFVLTAGLIGFVGWEAAHRPKAAVPAVEVRAGKVHTTQSGFVVEFEARNTSGQTAAAVEIEATLTKPGLEPVVGSTTLSYVPGNSTERGGIFLPTDPRSGQLALRALGYSEP